MPISTAIRLLLSLNYRTSNHQRGIDSHCGAVSDRLDAKKAKGQKGNHSKHVIVTAWSNVKDYSDQLIVLMLDSPVSFPGENFPKS